ncbi:MAG: hypothetical protein LBS31_09210 [Candidatus Adiutrix sp.]|nr:hypothetical protein [Candidatus Adiutrix sp.]
MSYIGNDPGRLPSVWAEARPMTTLRNARTNLPQVAARAETGAVSYETTGPARRTLLQTPQAVFRYSADERLAGRVRPDYHPDDYLTLSNHYNTAGRGAYHPNPNPVIIDKII